MSSRQSKRRSGAGTPKQKGRPKVPWEPFAAELERRFKAGEALPTLEEEARHLASWGAAEGISYHGRPLGLERIRERIKKRLGPTAQHYKNARQHHLRELGRAAFK